jgi:hypothetical protein
LDDDFATFSAIASSGCGTSQVEGEYPEHLLESPDIGTLSNCLTRTPPSSPKSCTTPSPTSPGYQDLQLTAEKSVKNHEDDTWEDLMKDDSVFALQMESIEGIKDWWRANLKQWLAQKQAVARAERSIIHLRQQKRLAENSLSGERREAMPIDQDHINPAVMIATMELESQEFNVQGIKAWFINNKVLMRQVWRHLQDLKNEERVEKLEASRYISKDDQRLPDFEFVNIQGHYDQDVSV